MDILDDMGSSKLSAKVFFKVNSFNNTTLGMFCVLIVSHQAKTTQSAHKEAVKFIVFAFWLELYHGLKSVGLGVAPCVIMSGRLSKASASCLVECD